MAFLWPPAGTRGFFRSESSRTLSCAAPAIGWTKRGLTPATKVSRCGSPGLSRSHHLFEAGQKLLPFGICLPEKDLPLLLAAIEARAA